MTAGNSCEVEPKECFYQLIRRAMFVTVQSLFKTTPQRILVLFRPEWITFIMQLLFYGSV